MIFSKKGAFYFNPCFALDKETQGTVGKSHMLHDSYDGTDLMHFNFGTFRVSQAFEKCRYYPFVPDNGFFHCRDGEFGGR